MAQRKPYGNEGTKTVWAKTKRNWTTPTTTLGRDDVRSFNLFHGLHSVGKAGAKLRRILCPLVTGPQSLLLGR